MTLAEICAPWPDLEILGAADIPVTAVVEDSRRVENDTMFVAVSGSLEYKALRRTIGGLEPEKGVKAGLYLNNKYAESENFPRVWGNLDLGISLPIKYSSLWLRSSLGYSWGDPENTLSNYYFGGFGNNNNTIGGNVISATTNGSGISLFDGSGNVITGNMPSSETSSGYTGQVARSILSIASSAAIRCLKSSRSFVRKAIASSRSPSSSSMNTWAR